MLTSTAQKIVLVRGAFDVLHVGHIRALEYAKARGDFLVVALDSDALVAQRKPGRPIFPQNIRAEVLAALKPVDDVLITNIDGAYDVMEQVKPNILALKPHSDTSINATGSRDKIFTFCRERNIDIITLPHIKGFSSSSILKKLDI